MSDRSNQHFVPKWLLRMCAGHRHKINVLDKRSGRILLSRSIKRQCALQKFYGEPEVEALFCPLESQQSVELKRLREMAWSPPVTLEPPILARVWEAVALQRARTQLEAEKHQAGLESLCLEVVKRYASAAPGVEDRDSLVECLDRGDIAVTSERRWVVATSLQAALQNTLLLSDLDLYVLKNQTDYPFVMGDSPVVFYNSYCRNVTHRGVLGFTTPGLQVFFPLDSKTLLMLVDGGVYSGRFCENLTVDIFDRSDVSQLNALQLHHSLNAVYFGDARHQEYIRELWDAHKARIVQPKTRFESRNGWLVKGEPVEDGLYIEFEPHLNIRLSLSFIGCTPIHPSQYVFRRRSPELYEQCRKRALT